MNDAQLNNFRRVAEGMGIRMPEDRGDTVREVWGQYEGFVVNTGIFGIKAEIVLLPGENGRTEVGLRLQPGQDGAAWAIAEVATLKGSEDGSMVITGLPTDLECRVFAEARRIARERFEAEMETR